MFGNLSPSLDGIGPRPSGTRWRRRWSKWWTNCGKGAGEAVSGLAGMMKARKSNFGVTNVATATSSFKRLRGLSQTRRFGYLNLFNNSQINK